MSQPKVYEFAKEIGMETIALMDKIRAWKLPVKSHMAALDEDTIAKIRGLMADEAAETAPKKKAAKKKKTAAKKKATAKKATAKKKTAKKATTVVKKTAVRVTKKAAAVTEEAEVEAVEAADVKPKTVRKKSAVIRRKAVHAQKDEEKLEDVEMAPEEVAASVEETPVVTAEEPVTVIASEEVQESVAAPVEVKEEVKPAKPAKPARPVPASMAAEAAGDVAEKPRARKNIVGRMDLSKVRRPSGGGGQRDSQGSGDKRTRPAATGPRNIRTGFVAPAPVVGGDDQRTVRRDDKGPAAAAAAKKKAGANAGQKTEEVQSFIAADFRKREVIFQPKKKRVLTGKDAKKTQITVPKASKRIVKVHNTLSVSALAQQLGVKVPALMKKLISEGVMANMNTELDFDTISLLATEYNFEAQNLHKSVDELIEDTAFGDLKAEGVSRPPVVTVMGHVDHGKTTLLDAIRKADVAAGEAGGITQHIGAYKVGLGDDKVMTFIDTPGHAAFTAMRERGANVTDIVIIVVAADDGVMPQTEEAISHAKAADVPIIVAVNKIDRPNANIDKIKQQLTEYELIPEEWGGNTIFCEVSALQKQGITELLEQVHLVSEILELKANTSRSATGVVIESRMEKGRGNVATVLIQDGVAKKGQYFVAGAVPGRIRMMLSDQGKAMKEAHPGDPVELSGLSSTPQAGDRFDICESEKKAEEISRARKEAIEKEAVPSSKMSLEAIFSKVKNDGMQELPVVLKSDVAGTNEAIKGSFEKVGTDEVKVKVIHSGVGGISESDVLLASTSGGLVIGFNVRPDSAAQRLAKEKGVEIKCYSIIYNLLDDIKKAMSGLLSPDIVEKARGTAEVRETFSVPKIGVIGGCFVTDGKIARSDLLRLVRDGRVVYEGKVSSLKRFKDDAKEVASGYECGIGIENFNDLKPGDIIEAYFQEEIAREL